jgi:PIN domain nuclease of toxin-antitoxin system
MRLLLDSHVIVWWSVYPGRLRASTRDAIISPDNDVLLSAASVWELGLKIARQKLSLPEDFVVCLIDAGLEELPVSIAHASRAMALPPLHGDPFDRLLIGQALEEGLVLVTSDREIVRYDVPTMEA